MTIKAIWALLAAVAVPTAAHASDECTALSPRIDPRVVTFSYDPFAAASPSRSFHVEIRSEDCPPQRNIFLEIGSDIPAVSDGYTLNAIGPGGEEVQFEISDREANNGGGRGDVFNMKRGMEPLYVFIERGQVVSPGQYRASLLAIERLNNGNRTGEAVTPFELVIIVAPAVGLAPAIGSRLDLGELSDNDTASQPVSFDAYANVDYELEIMSEQQFRLRQSAAGQPDIGYLPVLDSAVLPTSGARRDFARPLGRDSRRRHQLNVQVPSISGKPAGDYSDVLIVQINARLGS